MLLKNRIPNGGNVFTNCVKIPSLQCNGGMINFDKSSIKGFFSLLDALLLSL